MKEKVKNTIGLEGLTNTELEVNALRWLEAAGIHLDPNYVVKHLLRFARASFREATGEPLDMRNCKARFQAMFVLLAYVLAKLPDDHIAEDACIDRATLEPLIKIVKHCAREILPGAGDDLRELLEWLRKQRKRVTPGVNANPLEPLVALSPVVTASRGNNSSH